MKISQKGLYALQAMMMLARRYDQGAIRIRDIAYEEGLPEKFLELILVELRNARIVESVREQKAATDYGGLPLKFILQKSSDSSTGRWRLLAMLNNSARSLKPIWNTARFTRYFSMSEMPQRASWNIPLSLTLLKGRSPFPLNAIAKSKSVRGPAVLCCCET